MSYREEFPDYPVEAMPSLPAKWIDQSWKNDACPCFHREIGDNRYVAMFVDYPEAKDREFPECARFVVFLSNYSMAIDDASPREGFEEFSEALAYAGHLIATCRPPVFV